EEYPEYFNKESEEVIFEIVQKSLHVEAEILDWIFEDGELGFISKENLLNFMKYRTDESFQEIGLNKMFQVTNEQYKPMSWFEEEVFANSLDDFFAKRPVDYTKHDKSITAADLF